jgi:Family of unknown function (DUF6326)
MKNTKSGVLEDLRVDVRVKLAALWAAEVFLQANGDIIEFFRAGVLKDFLAGKTSGIEISQGILLGMSAYILIPTAMVFLSLVLKPVWNRWTNIVLGAAYVLSVVALTIGETWAYYIFLSIADSVLLLVIVWYAWRWPRLSA